MIRAAMKPILFLSAIVSLAAALMAEEPKDSPQRGVDEISKEIEALQQKLNTLDEEKQAILRKTSDHTTPARNEPASSERKVSGNIKTAIVKGRKIVIPPHPAEGALQWGGIHGHVIIDREKNVAIFPEDIELNVAEYMTPKMSVEMAERHSAEKIKAQVREADARAKRILDGHPSSLVHGN